jgi:hypothetical protein
VYLGHTPVGRVHPLVAAVKLVHKPQVLGPRQLQTPSWHEVIHVLPSQFRSRASPADARP